MPVLKVTKKAQKAQMNLMGHVRIAALDLMEWSELDDKEFSKQWAAWDAASCARLERRMRELHEATRKFLHRLEEFGEDNPKLLAARALLGKDGRVNL